MHNLNLPTDKKIILAFGTFDKFHPGHQHYLTEAKKLGEYLVVVVARDVNVEKLKKKKPRDSESERLENVANFGPVDHALLGFKDWTRREEIFDLVKPSVICLGYDQAPGFVSPSPDIEVARIDAYMPEKYKSSLL